MMVPGQIVEPLEVAGHIAALMRGIICSISVLQLGLEPLKSVGCGAS